VATRKLAPLAIAAALVLAGGVAAGSVVELRPLAFMRPRLAAPASVTGRWIAEGDRGSWDVTIAAAGEAFTYDATDRLSDDHEHGVGLLRGGHLFVAFPPMWGGITVYRVAPDGSAQGEWTEQPRALSGAPLVMLGAVELDAPSGGGGTILGEHAWRSRAWSESGPPTTAKTALVVTTAGAALHFQWAPVMEGVGMQRGPWVAAVWGTASRRMSLAAYDFEAKEIRGVRVILGEAGALRDRLVRAP
jgi:hypothetical protein